MRRKPEAARPIVTASLGKYQAREPAYEQQLAAVAAVDRTTLSRRDAAELHRHAAHAAPTPDEVNAYLWEVYQRQPTKKDRGGDFTWKDPAAAKRVGKTLQAYVILGMDADLRELALSRRQGDGRRRHRMDHRQRLPRRLAAEHRRRPQGAHRLSRVTAARARSAATATAARSTSATSTRAQPRQVFRWIDDNGAKFGLHRPIAFDPPHVEPRNDWRRLATKLRTERTAGVEVAEAETQETAEDNRPAAKRKVRNARVASARGNRPARNRRN